MDSRSADHSHDPGEQDDISSAEAQQATPANPTPNQRPQEHRPHDRTRVRAHIYLTTSSNPRHHLDRTPDRTRPRPHSDNNNNPSRPPPPQPPTPPLLSRPPSSPARPRRPHTPSPPRRKRSSTASVWIRTASLRGSWATRRRSRTRRSSSTTLLDKDRGAMERAAEGVERAGTGMEGTRKLLGTLQRMTEGKGWWGRMGLLRGCMGSWFSWCLWCLRSPSLGSRWRMRLGR